VFGLLSCQTLLRRVVYLQLMPAELVRIRCQQLIGEQTSDLSKQHADTEHKQVCRNFSSVGSPWF